MGKNIFYMLSPSGDSIIMNIIEFLWVIKFTL